MMSILYGGITHHYIGSNLPYCNKINANGSIVNEYFIGLLGNKKNKIGIISGKDSACGNIMGPISSFTINNNLEFIAGGYNTNYKKFRKLGIEPPSFNGFTPVVGIDYRIKLTKNISIDNLFSIGIITHALRIDF